MIILRNLNIPLILKKPSKDLFSMKASISTNIILKIIIIRSKIFQGSLKYNRFRATTLSIISAEKIVRIEISI